MTQADDFPAAPHARPLWLITLADLALLLVGFFVLMQASQTVDRKALADGIRAGFGETPSAPSPDPVPVAAAGVFRFATGSATIVGSTGDLRAWAHETTLDPRLSLRVTASVDGTPADVDPDTGSGAVLAADRARAVAASLAHIAPGRIIIQTAERPSRRQVVVTLAFTGEKQ